MTKFKNFDNIDDVFRDCGANPYPPKPLRKDQLDEIEKDEDVKKERKRMVDFLILSLAAESWELDFDSFVIAKGAILKDIDIQKEHKVKKYDAAVYIETKTIKRKLVKSMQIIGDTYDCKCFLDTKDFAEHGCFYFLFAHESRLKNKTSLSNV